MNEEQSTDKLPQLDQIYVPRAKIVEYLLNVLHPEGGSKAQFFLLQGFRRDQWERFAEALCEHARSCPVTAVKETSHGVKYLVEGELQTPSGKRPMVRGVWLVEDNDPPRLITAYPLGGGR